MRARQQQKAEETAGRIIATAQDLFRRIGYGKTAVTDIARALGMSPANVYRFFPSKAAINEAIAESHLSEVQGLLGAVVGDDAPAGDRLERFVLELHRYNKTRCVSERCMHDMVTAAMEENWAAVEAHIAVVRGMLTELVADGQKRAEFAPDIDPAEAAGAIFTGCIGVLHPAMIAQFAHTDLEERAVRLVRLLIRGLRAPAAFGVGPEPPQRGANDRV
ncbi:MAG: TetR family transcriptional regulator [Rhodospirillaceae bacterium]|nr:TetR family transcriptional regulator [Rhodospirillaceae bacterium]